MKNHARQLKKWIRGQVERPGLEELRLHWGGAA